MDFEPIAIVGKSCLFPEAYTPTKLWHNSLQKRCAITRTDLKNWQISHQQLMQDMSQSNNQDGSLAWGGYITGFEHLFNVDGFAIDKQHITPLDTLFHWLLYVGRAALEDAALSIAAMPQHRAGAIFGHLLYPTPSLNEYTWAVWLNQDKPTVENTIHPSNRFMSGWPVQLLARALNLNQSSFALDAACASAIYAVKLACDRLQQDSADIMLAGAIHYSDDLFIHKGFAALQALSVSGYSRPLHPLADGLVPSQGAGCLVLKRLSDAVEQKDKIHGVIRGIGLNNDGNANTFLAPNVTSQYQAMHAAYKQADLSPDDIQLVEVHATGAPVGDAAEISSMKQLFSKTTTLSTLKANIGHSLTASGMAAIVHALSAIEHGILPPSLYAETSLPLLDETQLHILSQAKAWQTDCRRAAINCFGFGGNNAHLLIEQFKPLRSKATHVKTQKHADSKIAIVGIGIIAAQSANKTAFFKAYQSGQSQLRPMENGQLGGIADSIDIPFHELSSPPNDLASALSQQLYVLKAAQEATSEVSTIPWARTSIIVGMQCDPSTARYGLRWRLKDLLLQKAAVHLNDEQLNSAKQAIIEPLQAAGVLGTLPNIVTNRLNDHYNARGPSFSLANEQLSGLSALQLAQQSLMKGEVDAAMVAAVDMCCEPVQAQSAQQCLPSSQHIPGDAAVVLILKRLEDAVASNNTIYAVFKESSNPQLSLQVSPQQSSLTPLFGHAHAASGLLTVATAALACQQDASHAQVLVQSFEGDALTLHLGHYARQSI